MRVEHVTSLFLLHLLVCFPGPLSAAGHDFDPGRALHNREVSLLGRMHEKYDATRPGERGKGGEYTPQVGFGWSNGAVLWMLDTFARPGSHMVAKLEATVA